MPSQYDNSYNYEYSKPTYDTPEEKIKFQTIREADYVLETRAPRDPTREEEIQYLDWLENEFKTDPWITHRFRKYTAGPKRWPWKNQREQKNNVQMNQLMNFGIGFMLTWPLGVYMGRRAQRNNSGTAVVPFNRYMHDFINVDPTFHARRVFRRNFFMWCTIGGIAFASLTVSSGLVRDEWYSRPDLKPFPAMVPQEALDDNDKVVLQTYYKRYRDEKSKENAQNKTWYRLLFPLSAKYDTDRNPYHGTHKENVYNPYNTYYSKANNVHFRHHLNE